MAQQDFNICYFPDRSSGAITIRLDTLLEECQTEADVYEYIWAKTREDFDRTVACKHSEDDEQAAIAAWKLAKKT